MPTSSRLAVATHVLAGLALADGHLVRSDDIARSVNTNPTFVRRLLGLLSNAGLVQSQLGQGGGVRLLRSANAITLLDVYRAVEDAAFFSLHHDGPNPHCPIGKNITPILCERFGEVTLAMERALTQTTIAEVAREVEERAGASEVRRVLRLYGEENGDADASTQ